MGNAEHLLEVKDLRTVFAAKEATVHAVSGVSFHVDRGETVAIVGESGSGKSVTAMSIMRLLEPSGQIVSGSVRFNGRDLTKLSEAEMRGVRGQEIAMISQDPLSSLNPSFAVGWQVAEALRMHRSISKADALQAAIEVLGRVGITNAASRIGDYPHQFSGGMRQRVMIAMGLITEPELLIADEPTTALDVTIQAQILELLRELNRSLGMATLLITHNLGAVAKLCERTIVMYAGKIVESGTTDELFADPKHPYTRLLVQAIPRITSGNVPLVAISGAPPNLVNLPPGCAFHPRCPFAVEKCRTETPTAKPVGGSSRMSACWITQEGGDIAPSLALAVRNKRALAEAATPVLQVIDLQSWYTPSRQMNGKRRDIVRAVNGVSLEVARGETLAVVGESGCGKTTLAHTIMRLRDPHAGQVWFDGKDITNLKGAALRRARRRMGFVFQDPYSSLNPRHTVAEIVGEPLMVYGMANKSERTSRIIELLELVGLDPRFMRRYPHQFSGGQRQRIAVARALASDATLLVCDEPTSALDVSIQAQVIALLERLQDELGLSYLFISHDLAVVRYIADRVAVMYGGEIVETGPTAELFDNPSHPYTQALIEAVPIPDPRLERERTAAKDVRFESMTATEGLVL